MRTATTRRVATMVAVVAMLVAVGCAKDEAVSTSATTTAPPVATSSNDSTGSTPGADTCTLLDDLAETSPEDVEDTLDVLDEIRVVVPDDEAADWDELIDAYEQFLGLDQEQSYDLGGELVDDPDLLDAVDNLNDFAYDECDVLLGVVVPYDPGRRTAPLDPRLDPPAEDDGPFSDDDPTSIDSLQAHLQADYGTEAWWPVLDDATSWSSSTLDDVVEWEVTLSSSPASTALPVTSLTAACDAMASYLDTYEEGDVLITIKASDEVDLVTRAAGAPCAAA